MVDTPRKEIQDMNVMELIEKISETIKIAALNLWETNRDTVDNIGVAFRIMEMLTETNDTKITNKNVKDIAMEMLDSDDESLTSASEYDSDSD